MALTTKEIAWLDKFSRYWPGNFHFGTRLQELFGGATNEGTIEGTPVNAVNATGLLTLTDVVKDGETVTISNPAKTGTNVYEFLADVAQTKTVSTHKIVNIEPDTVKATGTLTLAVQPTVGDTLTIGANTYTFVAAGTAGAVGEVSVGDDLAGAKLALVGVINGTDGLNTAHPLVSASAFVGDVCTLTAFVGGTGGNGVSTVETFANVDNVFGAETLGSGADCSAADAITALVAAINAQDTQEVTAAPGEGTTVTLTADVAGIIGNDINTTSVLANGSFGAAKLSGGINGTVGSPSQLMIDADYVYVAIAANTISGKNWRRVSVGSAF